MGIYTKLLRENSNIDNINITAEQINELAKFLNDNISLSSINENYEILNESINFNFLDKLGIKNSKSIKKDADKLSNNIAKTIKSEGINEKSKSKILTYYNEFFSTLNKTLDLANIDINTSIFGKEYDINKVKDAFLIFIIGTMTTSIIANVLVIFFGLNIGQILVTAIVAPIVEETEKQIAIRRNCSMEYTIIFNTYEFSYYFISLNPILGKVNAIKLRLIPVGMHLTNTIIQFLTNNVKLQQKLGIENDKNKQTKLSLIGQLIGTIIHCAYNSLALMSNNKIVQHMTLTK